MFPNHYYVYIRDREWGPAFIKTVAYAPYGVWIYLNGHEWAKRQAAKRGIAFQALDNGFRSVEDADALQGICQTLYYRDIERFWEYWEARLPSPLTAADHERGYHYRLSVRQLELSDTRVFERPAQVRDWFELTLKDQLALGRPDNVQIVFGRKIISRTPGRFRTRIINDGVEPQIQAHYKHSKVKQYLKEGRALRTETTINDPGDFGVGRSSERHQLAGADAHRPTRSTSGSCRPSLPRATARPTRPPCIRSCRRRPMTAYQHPPCASANKGSWRCSPACAPTATCSRD